MIKRKIVVTACCTAGIAALLMTAGYSAGATSGEGASDTPTPSAGSSSASETASAPPTDQTPTEETPTEETPEPSSGPSDESATPRCLTPDLAGSVEAVEGGGSAGHYEVAIVLKNEAAAPCILQGWPGVSFVGEGDGKQLGAAATLDRSSPHGSVTLDPGSAAHADVLVANAENYGDECGQTPADGFRVYPPGEKRSLFVQNDELTLTACTNPDDELLDVQAFQPGG